MTDTVTVIEDGSSFEFIMGDKGSVMLHVYGEECTLLGECMTKTDLADFAKALLEVAEEIE